MFDFLESVAYAEGEGTQGAADTGAATGAGDAGTLQQDPNGNQDNQEQPQPNILGMLFPILIFVLFFYFVLIRPQKKQEKKQKAMLAALQKDDKVVTIGGICGKITKIKDEYVYIETGSTGNPNERSIIKFERSAIKTVETIHE